MAGGGNDERDSAGLRDYSLRGSDRWIRADRTDVLPELGYDAQMPEVRQLPDIR